MKEVGSEFWKIDLQNSQNTMEYLNIGKDHKLLMSGRTAIDYVLHDIQDNKKIVYMPDYCCESMITPFIDNGYRIEYYKADLINQRYEIDENFDCSVFFGMSYFGYQDSNMDSYMKRFKEKNTIILEDITHRLLSEKNHCEDSDYLIASLRKWFPIYTGAIAVNTKKHFQNSIDHYTVNEELVKYKKQAMQLKREYIYDMNTECKEQFLELFKNSNKFFHDYQNRIMDEESLEILKTLDIEEIKKQRISNVKTIESIFHNTNHMKLLYQYRDGDCPLFVPIILRNRNDIRNKLIQNNIYCPIHWPKFNDSNNELYECELSLICDQRYTAKEMEQIVKIISENL